MSATVPAVHEDRHTYIGASDVAAILGKDPWRSRHAVWLEKTGQAEPLEESDPMFFGSRAEADIAERYAQRTGTRVVEVGGYRHPVHSFLVAHPDRRVDGQNRIVECKAVYNPTDQWGAPGTDEVPVPILLQVHHQLALSGAEACDVASMIRGQLQIYTVEHVAEFDAFLEPLLVDFWRYVERREPPPPLDHRDVRLLTSDPSKRVTADRTTVRKLNLLVQAQRATRKAKAAEEHLRHEVEVAMGDAEELVDELGRAFVTFKTSESTRLDTKAVRERHPDVFAECSKTSTSRRFLVKARANDIARDYLGGRA